MKKKAMRVKIRSRIPFPPTRVFKDRKKESRKRACRGKLKSFPFFLSGQRKHIKAKIKDIRLGQELLEDVIETLHCKYRKFFHRDSKSIRKIYEKES